MIVQTQCYGTIEKVILANQLKQRTWKIGRFCIVSLTTPLGLEGVGIARRNDNDNFSTEIGYNIAYGRALKSIIKKLNNETISHSLMG